MKLKISKIYEAYQIISALKLTGLELGVTWALIKSLSDMKAIVTNYDSFREETINKLRPDDWEEKQPKVQEAENPESEMDDSERNDLLAYLNEYSSRVNKILQKEWDSEVSIQLSPIPEDALKSIVETNDLDVNRGVLLYDFFRQANALS